ncbi:translation initiation factor IF3-1, mitochondrial-like [Olea europaea subsp. europaea]|uniref:Translation initiation factor IF3-1, mitochondrial-like n=1 Tax=Olea europaea subsp. europaea TaxID=158383 RepID=A0A8S0VEQ1_OLEEU|nr:translation initiation factor IF3-1, mitochondrial-like [Olea europaea subsp. europaea]
MAFWSRLKRTQLIFLSTRFKRSSFQIHGPIAVDNLTSCTGIPIINNSNSILHNIQLHFANNVRFFAAPVQAKEKKEEKDTSGPRLNEQVTAQFIRLVTDEGHSVVSRHEALKHAKSLKLDLVEVDRNAKPPVCKIVDYNKEKYQQQVKEKERSKSKCELKKGACKEVRFAAKIKQKDLQMKADTAKRLMESGYRVKCTAIEPSDELDLESLLSRFSALIGDVAIVESEPRVEKKQAYVVVRHAKFGPSKKGSGKKVSKTTESTSDSDQKADLSSHTVRPSSGNLRLKENTDALKSGSEAEDDITPEELSDAAVDSNKSEWAVFKGEDDFNKVFDITDDANGFAKSSRHEKVTVLSSADASSGSVVDSARARTASSVSTEVPKTGTENRYARDPRNRNPSMSPGTRNTIDHVSQFSNHGTEIKFNKNMSPQAQQTWRVETPANKDRNRDSSQPGVPNSTAKSYGVFSAQQVDSNLGEQNTPAQVNRYANRNPSDSARSPSRIGVSHRNSPISDARTSRGAGVERTQMGSRTR